MHPHKNRIFYNSPRYEGTSWTTTYPTSNTTSNYEGCVNDVEGQWRKIQHNKPSFKAGHNFCQILMCQIILNFKVNILSGRPIIPWVSEALQSYIGFSRLSLLCQTSCKTWKPLASTLLQTTRNAINTKAGALFL